MLVTSNSGIYVNDTGYPNPTRNFNVQSTISARFQCAGVAAQYRLNYVPPGNGQGASWNASPNLNGTGGVCKQGGPLLADPISDFKHELWQNVVTPGTTGSCAPDPTDNLWAASWSRKCGSVPLTRRSFSASDALTQCAAGLVTLAPGYYDDATGLNTLVSNSACNNVTVWLSPGTTSDPTTTSPGSRTDANDTAPGV